MSKNKSYFDPQSAFTMTPGQQPLQDLAEIRDLMRNATRFMSLSGLSGVSAGLIALIGAAGTWYYLLRNGIYDELDAWYGTRVSNEVLIQLVLIALLILVCAVGAASYFTIRHSRRQQQPIWTYASRQLALNIFIPLTAGAVFCIELAIVGAGGMVPGATLLFYGLALLNGSKYTVPEIRYLGMLEIGLGLISSMFWGWGLLFWTIGFGGLHIVYGAVMYYRYER
ncbi:MAG: hypothetical protein SF053_05095 [Bacteroidia bacterium]|nr:hypothetical protein [Bacteroidia bacterium]